MPLSGINEALRQVKAAVNIRLALPGQGRSWRGQNVPCNKPAKIITFLVMTKELPMAKLLEMARANPMYLLNGKQSAECVNGVLLR